LSHESYLSFPFHDIWEAIWAKKRATRLEWDVVSSQESQCIGLGWQPRPPCLQTILLPVPTGVLQCPNCRHLTMYVLYYII
jgi:hypothetical protein